MDREYLLKMLNQTLSQDKCKVIEAFYVLKEFILQHSQGPLPALLKPIKREITNEE